MTDGVIIKPKLGQELYVFFLSNNTLNTYRIVGIMAMVYQETNFYRPEACVRSYTTTQLQTISIIFGINGYCKVDDFCLNMSCPTLGYTCMKTNNHNTQLQESVYHVSIIFRQT